MLGSGKFYLENKKARTGKWQGLILMGGQGQLLNHLHMSRETTRWAHEHHRQQKVPITSQGAAPLHPKEQKGHMAECSDDGRRDHSRQVDKHKSLWTIWIFGFYSRCDGKPLKVPFFFLLNVNGAHAINGFLDF